MKHSIERQIRILILIMSLLAAGIYCLLAYFVERDSYMEGYIRSGVIAAWGEANTLDWSPIIQHTASEAELQAAETALQKMCKADDFLYSYVVVPIPEESAIHYIVACDKNSTISTPSDTGEMIERYSTIHMPLDQELLDVWYGTVPSSYLLINNSNGHALTSMSPIYGSDGEILAVFCIDIAISNVYRAVWNAMIYIIVVLSLVMLSLSFSIRHLLHRKVFRPINQIGKRMEGFLASSQEQFQPLPPAKNIEFSTICDSFNTMQRNAQAYVSDIEALAAEETRRQAELDVASELQLGLLPPPSFDKDELKISAALKPAITLSGDFYDYFQIDDHRFAMLIADVSGKGVSASIFMARAVTLLRAYASQNHSPSSILNNANRALSDNNPKMFFVTAFFCIYDRRNHTLTYANAGHNPPYLLTDSLLTLKGEAAVPLGLFPDEVYTDCTLDMKRGDTLFLYTDGVNEAVNEDGQFFGTERLEQLLQARPEKPIETVLNEIHRFVQNAPQSDDITMLCFEIGG